MTWMQSMGLWKVLVCLLEGSWDLRASPALSLAIAQSKGWKRESFWWLQNCSKIEELVSIVFLKSEALASKSMFPISRNLNRHQSFIFLCGSHSQLVANLLQKSLKVVEIGWRLKVEVILGWPKWIWKNSKKKKTAHVALLVCWLVLGWCIVLELDLWCLFAVYCAALCLLLCSLLCLFAVCCVCCVCLFWLDWLIGLIDWIDCLFVLFCFLFLFLFFVSNATKCWTKSANKPKKNEHKIQFNSIPTKPEQSNQSNQSNQSKSTPILILIQSNPNLN